MVAVLPFAGILTVVYARAGPTSRVHRDVGTTQGVVRGYLTPDPPHYAFLGLPYSRPPTRYDRFKAPKSPPRWDGIFEATHRVKCPQPDGEGVENCLVLNIFTRAPKSPPRWDGIFEATHRVKQSMQRHCQGLRLEDPGESLEICGTYRSRPSSDSRLDNEWGNFQAPVRLLREGLLIVTFNYRLGALGFLCLGITEAPGNAGLKDIVAALYWIHKNIANFGGNPLDITVYGFGFGAAAVELVLLSGLSNGLLHKVILESGTALSPVSVSYDSLTIAADVATMLGYKGRKDAKDLSMFFRTASAVELLKINLIFLPCIESTNNNAFIDTDLMDIFKKRNYHKVPMMLIFTDEVKLTNVSRNYFESIPENFELLLPNNLEFKSDELKHKIGELVKDFYFSGTEIGDSIFRVYEEYFRDIIMEYPVIKSAALHAQASSNPVYLMKFTYKCNSRQLDDVETRDYKLIDYLFNGNDASDVTHELALRRLVTMWSSFIKIGDPTPLITSLIPVVWPPVTASDSIKGVTGLIFGDVLAISDVTTERVIFWDDIYRRFLRKHKINDTMP
ncbi:juvenile hormone esterase-like [Achroia grisella]|uniref:juvenile hormone esterase-like n=1 Tax=Achroia grisella TaxID=688607 RepID=UPI0027D24B83|nr:juvenile hormone esterase-like [Achroia grisella]